MYNHGQGECGMENNNENLVVLRCSLMHFRMNILNMFLMFIIVKSVAFYLLKKTKYGTAIVYGQDASHSFAT